MFVQTNLPCAPGHIGIFVKVYPEGGVGVVPVAESPRFTINAPAAVSAAGFQMAITLGVAASSTRSNSNWTLVPVILKRLTTSISVEKGEKSSVVGRVRPLGSIAVVA